MNEVKEKGSADQGQDNPGVTPRELLSKSILLGLRDLNSDPFAGSGDMSPDDLIDELKRDPALSQRMGLLIYAACIEPAFNNQKLRRRVRQELQLKKVETKSKEEVVSATG